MIETRDANVTKKQKQAFSTRIGDEKRRKGRIDRVLPSRRWKRYRHESDDGAVVVATAAASRRGMEISGRQAMSGLLPPSVNTHRFTPILDNTLRSSGVAGNGQDDFRRGSVPQCSESTRMNRVSESSYELV